MKTNSQTLILKFKGCARCRQREFVHRAVYSLPSWLPQARIMSVSWKPWARQAPLMLMMRAPAVRIIKSRPRAKAASSNLLPLHRAVQKHAPTPHGMRARFACHSPANFEFPRPCRRPRKGAHHEHQRDPRDGGGSAAMACFS